ncbi:MAG: hypothetical protein ABFS38_04095 [Bacteroidota bacterium]
MNREFNRSFSTVVLLAFATCLVPLMAQSEKQIEQFKKEKKVYFTKQLELTESESKAFWPIYNDFHNRKMKIVEEERNAFMYAHKNSENLSDDEITEILGKIRKLKHEKVDLENEYYQNKFLEVLPPKKVLKLYKAEWDFRRHLIRELRGQSPNRGGGREGRPGSGHGAPPPDISF